MQPTPSKVFLKPVDKYRAAAEKGDLLAQFTMAEFYEKGEGGVAKDEKQSAAWYAKVREQVAKKAAEGDPDAQFMLAKSFFQEKSPEAFKWFEKAMLQGHLRAHTSLGLCFREGIGTTKNDQRALELYQMAADKGEVRAQNMIGTFYLGGKLGLPRDKTKAMFWFRKAAELNFDAAQYNLGVCLLDGPGKNLPEAATWLKKAAEQGFIFAQLEYARCLANGKGVAKDQSTALELIQRLADQGVVGAQFDMGVAYLTGNGLPQNKSKAAFWFRKAADQGFALAQCSLGCLYADGEGLPQNKSQAAFWFKKAAEQNDSLAQHSYAQFLVKGEGIPRDEKAAVEWCERAANQGLADAQYELGQFFQSGIGVVQSDKNAIEWYEKAVAQGHTDALIKLGDCYSKIGKRKEAEVQFLKALEIGHPLAKKCLNDLAKINDEKGALTDLREKANKGNVQAQYQLYLENMKNNKYEPALDWLRKAAAQGHPDALCDLGWLHHGTGKIPLLIREKVKKDSNEAVKLYRKAAIGGHTKAQYYLGLCLKTGDGTPKDLHAALRFMEEAAAAGHVGANFECGELSQLIESESDALWASARFNPPIVPDVKSDAPKRPSPAALPSSADLKSLASAILALVPGSGGSAGSAPGAMPAIHNPLFPGVVTADAALQEKELRLKAQSEDKEVQKEAQFKLAKLLFAKNDLEGAGAAAQEALMNGHPDAGALMAEIAETDAALEAKDAEALENALAISQQGSTPAAATPAEAPDAPRFDFNG